MIHFTNWNNNTLYNYSISICGIRTTLILLKLINFCYISRVFDAWWAGGHVHARTLYGVEGRGGRASYPPFCTLTSCTYNAIHFLFYFVSSYFIFWRLSTISETIMMLNYLNFCLFFIYFSIYFFSFKWNSYNHLFGGWVLHQSSVIFQFFLHPRFGNFQNSRPGVRLCIFTRT